MGLVVGIDLGNRDSQICYFQSSMKEPETISVLTGAEKFKIPTVLCKQNGRDFFTYGEEAKGMALQGDGILVVDLLKKALESDSIQLEGETYQTKQLFVIFLRKIWNGLVRHIGDAVIDRCMITVEEINKELLELLETVTQFLPLDPDRISIQNHEESFFYYSLLQDRKSKRNQSSVIFEHKKDHLELIELEISGEKARTRKKRIDFFVEYDGFGGIAKKEELDREFFRILQVELQKNAASFIYLIGDLFEKEWMNESLIFLCNGRRVFQGSNLYVKGSALSAMSELEHWEIPCTYLGEDCLSWEYGIYLDEQQSQFLTLAEYGQPWYQVEEQVECILEGTDRLEIVARDEMGQVCGSAAIYLDGISANPHFVTAVRLEFRFAAPLKAVLLVTDLGFGETTDSSRKIWTKVVEEWEEL